MIFPDWYKGGFDDIEFVLKCLLEKHFVGCVPAPKVFSWLPETFRDDMPLVCVSRVPGAIDDCEQEDTSEVLVFVMTASRAESWELAEFVRQVLMAHARGVMVDVGDYRASIVRIERSAGPQLSVDEDAFTERMIPLSFRVTTRRRASCPDYSRTLS